MSIADKLTTIAENQQKVFDAGKTKEWSDFWNAYQKNGNRTSYGYAFWEWYPECFKPKYDIRPTACQNMFYNFNQNNTDVSLKQLLQEAGVVLDTSNSTNLQNMFAYSNISEVGVIDASNASKLEQVFWHARGIVTVDEFIIKDDGSQATTKLFFGATKLTNITIKGVFGNSIDMSECPLSKASFISVINALSSTTTGKTASFKKSAKEAAFTADEWAALIATKSNWSFSLV